MAGDTPQDTAAPVVKPKRPIYRSYGELIRTLVTDARKRVQATKRVEVPPPAVTPEARRVADRVIGLAAQLRRMERTLADVHHLHVEPRGYNGERDKIVWTYAHRRTLENRPAAAYTARVEAINALKVKATLDTIDMTPKQAKTYLLKLQQRLASI